MLKNRGSLTDSSGDSGSSSTSSNTNSARLLLAPEQEAPSAECRAPARSPAPSGPGRARPPQAVSGTAARSPAAPRANPLPAFFSRVREEIPPIFWCSEHSEEMPMADDVLGNLAEIAFTTCSREWFKGRF